MPDRRSGPGGGDSRAIAPELCPLAAWFSDWVAGRIAFYLGLSGFSHTSGILRLESGHGAALFGDGDVLSTHSTAKSSLSKKHLGHVYRLAFVS